MLLNGIFMYSCNCRFPSRHAVKQKKNMFFTTGCQIHICYLAIVMGSSVQCVCIPWMISIEYATQTLISWASFLRHITEQVAFCIHWLFRAHGGYSQNKEHPLFFILCDLLDSARDEMFGRGSRSSIMKVIMSSIMKEGKIVNTHTSTHSSINI